MSEKHGLLKTEIRLVKKDEELANRILASLAMGEGDDQENITEILRYNMWTIQQFADITSLAQSTIANKCRPSFREGNIVTELDHCYPFADLNGMGPKFIVRNEKSEGLLP